MRSATPRDTPARPPLANRPAQSAHSARQRRSRGLGLLDALISVAVLSVCSLGLVRFQARMISHNTESQARLLATQFADELMSTVLVDNRHAGCYTLPSPSDCDTPAARERAADWQKRAEAGVPSVRSITAALDARGERFTVRLVWQARNSADEHQVELTTDVR